MFTCFKAIIISKIKFLPSLFDIFKRRMMNIRLKKLVNYGERVQQGFLPSFHFQYYCFCP